MKNLLLLLFICSISLGLFSQIEETYFGETTSKSYVASPSHIKESDGIIFSQTIEDYANITKVNLNGDVVWSTIGGDTVQKKGSVRTLLKVDSALFAISNLADQRIWKVDPKSGNIIWKIELQTLGVPNQISNYDSSRILLAYATSSGSVVKSKISLINKYDGLIDSTYILKNISTNHFVVGVDSKRNIYYSRKDSIFKLYHADLDSFIWKGVASFSQYQKIYIDEFDSIYAIGRSKSFGGIGKVASFNIETGKTNWQIYSSSDEASFRSMIDKGGYLYFTWQHVTHGGGSRSRFWTTKINKSTGTLSWNANPALTASAIPGMLGYGQMAAYSVDVDDSSDVYLSGYYRSSNYGPGNWGIVKLDGSNGTKIYESTISNYYNGQDNVSNGLIISLINNRCFSIGDLATKDKNNFRVPVPNFVEIKLSTGKAINKRVILGATYASKTIAIENYQCEKTLVLKQINNHPTLELYNLNKSLSWSKKFDNRNILMGGNVASSVENDVLLSAYGIIDTGQIVTMNGNYKTDSIYLFHLNSSGNVIREVSFNAGSENAKPISTLIENGQYYIFYTKKRNLYLRKFDDSLSSEVDLNIIYDSSLEANSNSILTDYTTKFILFGFDGNNVRAVEIDKHNLNTTNLGNLPFLSKVNHVIQQTLDDYLISGTDSSNRAFLISYNASIADTNWTSRYPKNTEIIKFAISSDTSSIYTLNNESDQIRIRKVSLKNRKTLWAKYIHNQSAYAEVVPLDLIFDQEREKLLSTGYLIENDFTQTIFYHEISTNGTGTKLTEKNTLFPYNNKSSVIQQLGHGSVWVGGQIFHPYWEKAGFIFEIEDDLTAPLNCEKCESVPNLKIYHDTTDAIRLVWDNSLSDKWIVEYDTLNFEPGQGTSNKIITDSNELIIGDLILTKTYHIYIRKVCGYTNLSEWSQEFEYKHISCPSPEILYNENLFNDEALINLEEYGTANQWQVEYDTLNFTVGSFTSNKTIFDTNPDTINLLQSYNDYEVYARSICGVNDTSEWSDSFRFEFLPSLGGNYTIDSAKVTEQRNFQSFKDFIQALNTRKVIAPVVVDVVKGSGPYHEKLIFTGTEGVSATNTIRINFHGETVAYKPTNFDKRIVGFNGAKHFTIDSMRLEALSSSYGFGIHFMNEADSNSILNSTIDMRKIIQGSIGSSSGIVSSNSILSSEINGNNASDLRIENNQILGGSNGSLYSGISLVGLSSSRNFKTRIINNKIIDFKTDGVYLKNQDNFLVSGNQISRPNNETGDACGINIIGFTDSSIIENNKIYLLHGGNQHTISKAIGIQTTNADASSTKPSTIRNNAIYNLNTNGLIYGIYNVSSDNYKYYHNTVNIRLSKASAYSARCFFQIGNVDNIELINNNFSVQREGSGFNYGIYFSNTISSVVSDYNNIFLYSHDSTNNYIGKINNDHLRWLSDWRTIGNYDFGLNSDTINPAFKDFSYQPSNPQLKNSGKNLFVTSDIDGNLRDTTPDIGAIEFDSISCVIPSNISHTANYTNTSDLNWTENGIATQWEIQYDTSGFPLGTARNKRIVNSNSQTTINSLVSGITYDLYIRSICGVNDTSAFSLMYQFSFTGVPMCGKYTVNANEVYNDTNFRSFEQLTSNLRILGMSCPVEVDVVTGSGPYYEKVIFKNIDGLSSQNTLTINGNGESVEFSPTNSDKRIVGFDAVKHITLDSLTIRCSSTNFGYGVHFMNNADSNTVVNCIIDISKIKNTNYLNSGGIIVSNSINSTSDVGSNASYLTIKNNYIHGDSLGGMFVGIGLTGASKNSKGNKIFNNVIKDFYSDGIYVLNQEEMTISGNSISRPNLNTVNDGYGLYLDLSNSKNNLIEKNSIHHMNVASSTNLSKTYGIYCYGFDGSDSLPNKIQNNLIYHFKSIGEVYAIYNYSSDNTLYYHNTISIQDHRSTLKSAYGFYQTASANGVDFRNNIISIKRSSSNSGNNYGIYLNTSATSIDCDYNMVFVDTTNALNAYYGYYGGNQKSLSDWKTVNFNSFGQNSFEDSPEFIGFGSFEPTHLNANNTATNLFVLEDFYNTSRSSTPDIGAIEFKIPSTIPSYATATINEENSVGIADSLYLNCYLSGTVAGIDLDSTSNLSFYLIDQSTGDQNGIHVLTLSNSLNYQVKEGDSLKVRGRIVQIDGLLSFKADSIIILSNNKMLPNAKQVTKLNETTESIILRIKNLTISSIRHFKHFDELNTSKGADSVFVRIYHSTDIYDSLSFKIGDTICNIVGVGSQMDPTTPYLDGYHLIPMHLEDLEINQCLIVDISPLTAFNQNLTVFPNPVKDQVNVKYSGKKTLSFELYNLMGQQLSISRSTLGGPQGDLTFRFSMSHLPKGVYLLNVIGRDERASFKIIKE